MSSKLPQTSRSFIAIFFVAMFSIVLACGSESAEPAKGGSEPTAEAEHPPSSPTPGVDGVDAEVDISTTVSPTTLVDLGSTDTEANVDNVVAVPVEPTSDEPAPTDTMPAEVKPSDPAISPTAVVPTETATASPAITPPDPTEPPLVNTPAPVANTAPDFTLPSVQGPEYTLSQFRGEQPVAVVFYRAYW